MSAGPLPSMPIWTDHGWTSVRQETDPFGDKVFRFVLSWWYDGFHWDSERIWW